jgi:hypothetical protein
MVVGLIGNNLDFGHHSPPLTSCVESGGVNDEEGTMIRIIGLVDCIIVLVVLWFAILLCLDGYRKFKKIKKEKS